MVGTLFREGGQASPLEGVTCKLTPTIDKGLDM